MALLANGWTVHSAETDEAYDILATDPAGQYVKLQVKTVRKRDDRRGELVVYAKKGNGTTYDLADADYIVGVWADDGAIPRVFLIANRLLTEYWSPVASVSEKWTELTITLDRTLGAAEVETEQSAA